MTAQRTISTRIWAELFLLALIWGGVFLAVRLALDEVPFVTSVAHRVFWAALILWGYVLARGLIVPRDLRTWGALLIMGCLNNVIPFSLMAWGQLHIESGLASVFNSTTAIFGVIVAAIVFADERLTLRKTVGSVIGFLGVATAIGLDSLRNFDITSLAQLAVIGGTLSYAFAGAWARLKLNTLAPQVAAAGMLTGSSVVMVPAAFFIDGVPSLDISLTAIGAIAYYVIFATAGAYLLYYRILAAAGSGNLMLVTLLMPPISILLGAIVLHETLSPNVYIGLGILALGLIILDGRFIERLNRD
ncbi:DMT family transporter [Octadecabacter sp. CECT 8868]|uniref:DMT family transporter n=1 Tax=Octadecabacter algicola TaxID=2909342 RepID=UPI001F199FA0|nr:DMT family transporter [Octadecabacter algicola]MCF2905500.1 DMT family transporter [Octadecabacter algicola]